METLKAIKERHSYRGPFEEEKVPLQDLRTIVEAGCAAPSGCNAQTTGFIIIDENPLMDSLRAAVDHRSLETAPNAIIVLSENRAVYEGLAFEKEDYAAAVENMLLAITDLGYASVWLDGVLRRDNRAQRVATLLNVPEKYKVSVILPVGKALEPGDRKEKLPFEERAWFNRFGD